MPRQSGHAGVATAVAQPFVKWAGGKRRLAAAILAVAPRHAERFVEPFAGGGAVALASGRPRLLLNDANADLMAAYLAVRDALPALLARLDQYAASHSADQFYRVRGLPTDDLPPLERAARFIYLNKTCYNGLWRVNRRGHFNTPLGRYARPRLYDRAQMTTTSAALAGATLACGDYRDFIERHVRPGDVVYLDPPYLPAGASADFRRYTDRQFREADHVALAGLFRDLARQGAYPILTNADTPLARELYASFHVRAITGARAINHDGRGRGVAREILVTPWSDAP